ncbi:Adenine DNA glycosylase [bioreactor metagenome]|uniref:Adenine DNA glycosylase n=1 Tax=bioreactor metagenome TaxID=1076179 RepID=A0A645ELB2_9ZZZZ
MLQQTRVETVIPYYERFMHAVPNIEALAQLDEGRLLKLWEGLGYYSRAKSLQKAARTVVEKHGGVFPRDFDDIRRLPGIGDYTAGAIASICFGSPTPAVDGNVLRVVSRLIGCTDDIADSKVKSRFGTMLAKIYPADRTGDFTQSLMELGAIVCLPGSRAKCGLCPLAALCAANAEGTQSALPVKSGRAPRKKEQKTVFILHCGDLTAVRRRDKSALLGGLFEFPNAEGQLTVAEAAMQLARWGVQTETMSSGIRKKHIFTHIEWHRRVCAADVSIDVLPSGWVYLDESHALPTAYKVCL